jgi:hypothetical protein
LIGRLPNHSMWCWWYAKCLYGWCSSLWDHHEETRWSRKQQSRLLPLTLLKNLKQSASRAGASDFISKPFNIRDIERCLQAARCSKARGRNINRHACVR